MDTSLQYAQDRGRQYKDGLEAMPGDEPKQYVTRIDDTLGRYHVAQLARDGAWEVVRPLRVDLYPKVRNAKELVESFVRLITEVHNGRYALIASTVEAPGYDRIELGCTFEEKYKADESVRLFASVVTRACVDARDLAGKLTVAEAKAKKLDMELEVAANEAEMAQLAADTFIRANSPPGSKARNLIKRKRSKRDAAAKKAESRGGSKNASDTSSGSGAATSASPANAPATASHAV